MQRYNVNAELLAAHIKSVGLPFLYTIAHISWQNMYWINITTDWSRYRPEQFIDGMYSKQQHTKQHQLKLVAMRYLLKLGIATHLNEEQLAINRELRRKDFYKGQSALEAKLVERGYSRYKHVGKEWIIDYNNYDSFSSMGNMFYIYKKERVAVHYGLREANCSPTLIYPELAARNTGINLYLELFTMDEIVDYIEQLNT